MLFYRLATQCCLPRSAAVRTAYAWRRREAFTLLELVLALSLAAILLYGVVAGIRMQLRAYDIGQTDVEEAQLARALASLMADDLSRVMYAPTSSGNAAASGASISGSSQSSGSASSGTSGGSGSGSSGTGSSGQSGTGSSGSGSSSGSTTSSTMPVSTTQRRPLGLRGTQAWLELDCNRIPREDEYNLLVKEVAGQTVNIHVGEVKTVSYFLQQGTGGGSTVRRTTMANDQGLARAEMDQPSAAYRYGSDSAGPLTDAAVVLAPEVQSLTFRYFDGTTWYAEWDSQQMGALPRLVEVQLGVRTSNLERGVEANRGAETLSAAASAAEFLLYRTTIALPLGNSASSVAALQASASGSSSGSSTGSGTSSSSASGSGGR